MSAKLRIGVIADFNPELRPHQVINEVLDHTSQALSVPIEVEWIPTESLAESVTTLEPFDALWSGTGSPFKSLEGALNAIRFGRERNYPFIGTCAGFQHIVIEFARNVLGIKEANSAEYDPSASKLFVTPLTCSLAGKTFKVKIQPDSRAYQIYGSQEIIEHYYCTFGLNPEFQNEIENGGLKIVGIDDTQEARIIEIPAHRFFIGTLFVPQLFADASKPHP